VSAPRDLPRWLALPYAAYALTVFTLLALLALVLVLPVPVQALRRRMVRAAARLALIACGMRLTVLHAGQLPPGACVVVANHSSYLDGIVLYAALPPVFGFVIKREMSKVPLANLLLRRIGAHYVDRGGQKSARDTRRLLRNAAAGSALAFFPEGTFEHQPGLLRFRSGAFVVAANAGMPVMPIAIRGTRAALPARTLLPRPARIEIELTPLLPAPASTKAEDIAICMKAARKAILARIAEPDLAPDG
jgi:1-acyl-sn-glycerol-3-phosphate acyltransferase